MGEPRHDGLAVPGQVVLAYEPPFAIGRLRVDPPTRQAEFAGLEETLEPRVMQVFVVLARARGKIVTRDELINYCWDGRIVSDDAINRVLSRIRQVGAGIGGGCFKLETVTKVGYRLVEVAAHSPLAVLPPGRLRRGASNTVDRRAIIVGTAAAAVAVAAGGLVIKRSWIHVPSSEALELYRRGDLAQRAGVPDQTRQSVTYFERAVAIDPDYAEAWGALALAYTHSLDGFAEAQLASMPGLIRSAARRALALDPDNADAQLALICTPPMFRNWASMEAQLRRLCDRFPSHWLAHGRLGMVLYQVGRFNEGAELHKKVIAIDPMITGPYVFAASALVAAGRIQEADTILHRARERWPAHPMLWIATYNVFLFTGRSASAAAFLMDPEALPSGFGPQQVGWRLTLARAVDGGKLADIESSIRKQLEFAVDTESIVIAAPVFAMLGRIDLTFASLDRYFLNRGPFGTPSAIGPYTRRYTDVLFRPGMAPARADPRFAKLLTETGLDTYWRRSRTVPDYRRSA